MNKKVLLVIILLALSILIVLGYIINVSEKTEYITAFEGLEISSDYINTTYGNGTLIHVQSMTMIENGYSIGWSYNYRIVRTNSNVSNVIDVNVFNNGTIEDFNLTGTGLSDGNITNWLIDSNEAYDSSMEISAIQNFASNSNTEIFALVLTGETGYSVWHIHLVNSGILDDPKWANIEIDANTGEVLYVDVDD